jgi:hypothetical protein
VEGVKAKIKFGSGSTVLSRVVGVIFVDPSFSVGSNAFRENNSGKMKKTREKGQEIIAKPLEGYSHAYLLLVLNPKRGKKTHWAVMLMLGKPSEKSLEIARLDSAHQRLHVDLHYYEGESGKFWLQEETHPATNTCDYIPEAEAYLRCHADLFIENYLRNQIDFRPPTFFR